MKISLFKEEVLQTSFIYFSIIKMSEKLTIIFRLKKFFLE